MRRRIDRVGLRLKLRRQQAEAGDIVLLYADESEALTHPYLARVWAKRGANLRVPAPGKGEKGCHDGRVCLARPQADRDYLATKRSADFIALLEELDRLYGPKPGLKTKPVVMVLDIGPIHVSKATQAALQGDFA
jgi:DDE superfamily endonuclease